MYQTLCYSSLVDFSISFQSAFSPSSSPSSRNGTVDVDTYSLGDGSMH